MTRVSRKTRPVDRAALDAQYALRFRAIDHAGRCDFDTVEVLQTIASVLDAGLSAERTALGAWLVDSPLLDSANADMLLVDCIRTVHNKGSLKDDTKFYRVLDAMLERNRTAGLRAVWLALRHRIDSQMAGELARRVRPEELHMRIEASVAMRRRSERYKDIGRDISASTLFEMALAYGAMNFLENFKHVGIEGPVSWMRVGRDLVALDAFDVARSSDSVDVLVRVLDTSDAAVRLRLGKWLQQLMDTASCVCLDRRDTQDAGELLLAQAEHPQGRQGLRDWLMRSVEFDGNVKALDTVVPRSTLAMALHSSCTGERIDRLIGLVCVRAGLDGHFGIRDAWCPVYSAIEVDDARTLGALAAHGIDLDRRLPLRAAPSSLTEAELGARPPPRGEPVLDARGEQTGYWLQTPIEFAINHDRHKVLPVLTALQARNRLGEAMAARRPLAAEPAALPCSGGPV